MSFPIPYEFERAVLDRVASGRYKSTDDVLCELVDALEEKEVFLREIEKGLENLDREEVVTDDEAQELLQIHSTDDFDAAFEAVRNRCGIPLGPDYREFVDDEVESGRYASPREVLEAALWQLRRAEERDDKGSLAELRHEIGLGFESGDSEELIPGEQVEAHIHVRLRVSEVREFVERKISTGEYASVLEVVTAGLKLLMEEEEYLRREIERSRGRPTMPGDTTIARLLERRRKAND
jgi:putative addiction module CopG family antidote